ncbi:MAG: phosphodiester glycosidase family protein [Chitinophagales bacterium]
MNQIQLSRNMDIRMFFGNEKYNSIWKKLKPVELLFLLITLGFFLFTVSTNKTPNNNFNNSTSIIAADSTQKATKVTPQNNEKDPLVIYGDLLKTIESKQEERNTLSVFIESSRALMLKNSVIENKKDTLGNHKADSISIKLEAIKKIEAQKVTDSLTKRVKKIDADITTFNQQIPTLKANVQKVASEFIEKYISLANGQGYFTFKDVKYYLCVVDLQSKTQTINFHLKNKEGKSYNSISALLKDKELDSLDFLMVTNGGMYTPNHEPQGLFIEKGKTIKPIDESNVNNNTNFYLFPNGVFYVDSNNNANIKTTTEYSKLNKTLHTKYATQSGPMLVIDNKIHEKFVQGSKNINIRSGVGIMDNKRVIFLISDGAVNFWDFATVFKDIFGCKNALYLDGAISLMYLNKVNPSDVGGNFGPLISITKRKK